VDSFQSETEDSSTDLCRLEPIIKEDFLRERQREENSHGYTGWTG